MYMCVYIHEYHLAQHSYNMLNASANHLHALIARGLVLQVGLATCLAHVATRLRVADALDALDGDAGVAVKLVCQVRPAADLADIAADLWVADVAPASPLQSLVRCLAELKGELPRVQVDGIL